MIQAGASSFGGGWAGVPHSPTRHYTTIVVMLVAVTLTVRALAGAAGTLGAVMARLGARDE